MPPTDVAQQSDLRFYLRTLRRRRWVVITSIAFCLGIANLISFTQPRMYAASAKLLLKAPTEQDNIFTRNGVTPFLTPQFVQTEIEAVNTQPVADRVRDKIGPVGGVKAAQVGESQYIVIVAEHRVPKRAAEIANAYAEAYVDYRRSQAVEDLLAASQEIDAKIQDLQTQINAVTKELDSAPVCVDVRTTAAECAQRDNISQSINTRRTALLNQQALFRQSLDQLQVSSSVASGGVKVTTPAAVPTTPFQPAPRRNAAMGGFLGLLAGIGLAFVVERLDDTLKGKDDLETVLPQVPVVGLIPMVPDWKARAQSVLVAVHDPQAPAAEAYRILRTSVQFLGLDKEVRVIQVTSPNAEEGKTTTLANLAVSFARSGLRTVAVDCDLRRPRLHQFFDLPNDVGFTSVLLREAPLSQALQVFPGQRQLRVLTSGPMPPNPSELLSSRRTSELLAHLRNEADVVLIDSPPTLPVTDALVLSRRVDATILVTMNGKTSRKAAGRAVEMLEQVDAPVAGVVLNAAQIAVDYGTYSYSKYYMPAEQRAARSGVAMVGNDKSGRTAKKPKLTGKRRAG